MVLWHTTSPLPAREGLGALIWHQGALTRVGITLPSLLQTFWGQVFLPRRQEGGKEVLVLLPCCQIRALEGLRQSIMLCERDGVEHKRNGTHFSRTAAAQLTNEKR